MADFGNAKVSHGGEPSNQFAAIATANSAGTQPATYTATGLLDTLASDSADLPLYGSYRGLYVGTAGNIKFNDWDGNAVGPIAVPQGVLPFRPRRIYATGLTAAQIVGLR